MSTGQEPIEIDPETTTFTIKGVEGIVFGVTDVDINFEREPIFTGYSSEWADYLPGPTSYTVTIEARRIG